MRLLSPFDPSFPTPRLSHDHFVTLTELFSYITVSAGNFFDLVKIVRTKLNPPEIKKYYCTNVQRR